MSSSLLTALSFSPPSLACRLFVCLSDSSTSEFRHPVWEWVISSKLIWPLMIGSGTHSSVSDWPGDQEANFPRCSRRIVVALNYHLLCAVHVRGCGFVTSVCWCVCGDRARVCLCKCLSVSKELTTGGLAIMSSSSIGRWRGWKTHSSLSHTNTHAYKHTYTHKCWILISGNPQYLYFLSSLLFPPSL